MKVQWEAYDSRFEKYVKLMEELYEMPMDRRVKKAVKIVVAELNALIGAHNEVGRLVVPLKPVEIKLPFDSKEFAEDWTYYKEYLEESHQTYLPSRTEKRQLGYLHAISGKNEQRAMLILDFYIRNQYKTMFLPSDKQLTGEEVDTTKETNSASRIDLNAKKLDI